MHNNNQSLAAHASLGLVQQIARMTLTGEANGLDPGNDRALDGLIRQARQITGSGK